MTECYWKEQEQQRANLRRAALECGCTPADGKAVLRKRKDPNRNVPLKYLVQKKSEVKKS